MINKKFIYIILLVLIVSSFVPFLYVHAIEDSIYVWSNSANEIETINEIEKTGNFLDISCASGVLIEQTTGKVLYEHNSHEQLRPASVTKIMTILLIMDAVDSEKISLQDNVSCSEHAASMGGSQIWLEVRRNINSR